MKWFKNIHTLEELRKQYRQLLKKYHPDNEEGNVYATQEINQEYDILFAVLKEQGGGNFQKSKFSEEEDGRFRDMLQKIIHFDMEIEVIGTGFGVFMAATDIGSSSKNLALPGHLKNRRGSGTQNLITGIIKKKSQWIPFVKNMVLKQSEKPKGDQHCQSEIQRGSG